MCCVLDVFWPMAARLTELERWGRGAQIRRCKMAGWVWTQLQIEADGCMREFQIQTWFPFTAVPRSQRGQQPASVWELILCTPEESEPHFYHRDTLKKQLRKKQKTNHIIAAQRECSPSEVQQYISVGFTHSDKHFHFCHWLILYDWTVMGFGGSNPFVFMCFLF